MKAPLTICAFLAVVLAAPPSEAMSCSFVSDVGVAFGNYDVFELTPLDALGSLTFQCLDVGPSDTVVIHLSRGSSSTYFPRTLTQSAYELDYNLYLDAGRTVVWGDGTSGTSYYGPVTPTSGAETTVSVYGRLPAQQNARVGSYADTVVATVIF